ncbi:hypothetical protein NDU88_007949 [Pleurodeles waltl]|uniref:Uncharacterized protein n=1 Tax=Pleurodeles waltl TaxID=8319 RepID=A0AAV7NYU9_PLEWA|nr:hypothetical protein NDU88_007949 [Pleurodeles waltl]
MAGSSPCFQGYWVVRKLHRRAAVRRPRWSEAAGGFVAGDLSAEETAGMSHSVRTRVIEADTNDEDLQRFLTGEELPQEPLAHIESLEAPILEQEIQHTICSLPDGRTPGLDGLPIESCNSYKSVLLAWLYQIYEDAK